MVELRLACHCFDDSGDRNRNDIYRLAIPVSQTRGRDGSSTRPDPGTNGKILRALALLDGN
jgi:hypothetical protein